jgi:two-component system, chemotaxis family, response regulator PixG
MTTDTDTTVMSKIAHDLTKLQHQQSTGELVVKADLQSSSKWHLYFYMGRLVYATGSYHRTRRWYRAVRQICPHLLKEHTAIQVEAEAGPWEVQILSDWVKQGKISMAQARAIVQSSVNEVFFAFIDQPTLVTRWGPGKQIAQQMAFLSTEQVMHDAYQLRDRWRSAGLVSVQQRGEQFSPDSAPVLINAAKLQGQVAPETFQSLKLVLNGKNTVWDIAQRMQSHLPAITRALLPLLDQGIIDLEELPDLAPPITKAQIVKTSSSTSHRPNVPSAATIVPPEAKKLIVCIDDSPMIGQQMQQILEPAGYEMLYILDPLKGIATLLNRKPALIFLDLVMPNSNGYELCTFLRKTTAFRDTPIVILTGHDGVIDRVRAKMAGSTDFLSKPPVPAKVLQMIQKYVDAIAPQT